jgi:hypothetical protein
MKSRWITHKNKRVFIADFSELGDDSEAVRHEAEAIKTVLQMEPPASVMSITYVEGTAGTQDNIRVLLDLVPITNKYVRRRAIVGLRGFRVHLLQFFIKATGTVKFNTFSSMDDALDWIIL